MYLKRHLIELKDKKIILSEDIVTKGTTLKRMIKFVGDFGGEIVAITCVGNRTWADVFEWIPIISCIVPNPFVFYYDENTPSLAIENFEKLSSEAKICEKPKNDWDNLVKSMRN